MSKVSPTEVKAGLGFAGSLEEIEIVVGEKPMVRYSVMIAADEFLGAMGLSGDLNTVEATGDPITAVTIGSTAEVSSKPKRGRKAKPEATAA
jgi:hypothetical protein